MQHPTSAVPDHWENSGGIESCQGHQVTVKEDGLFLWKVFFSSQGKADPPEIWPCSCAREWTCSEHRSWGELHTLFLRRGQQSWGSVLACEIRKCEPWSREPNKDGHCSAHGLKTRQVWMVFTCTLVSPEQTQPWSWICSPAPHKLFLYPVPSNPHLSCYSSLYPKNSHSSLIQTQSISFLNATHSPFSHLFPPPMSSSCFLHRNHPSYVRNDSQISPFLLGNPYQVTDPCFSSHLQAQHSPW